jgi:HEAT repeat protein
VLGQSKNREALQWILDLLNDPEPRIRDESVKAIQRLAEINDQDVLNALFKRLEREGSEKVQATLIAGIGKLCRSDEILRLGVYLDSSNDRVVANAVEALGHHPISQVTDLLLPKLGSTHNRIKANAAMALFYTGNLQVQLHILNTLKPMLMHTNPLMRSSAAFAIGELTHIAKRTDRPDGTEGAALSDEWLNLSDDAKQFLAELQETVPMLVALLRDSDMSVKRQAVIALGKIKDRSSVLPIINTINLNLHQREILNDIAQALREIGSHRVVRDLLEKLM